MTRDIPKHVKSFHLTKTTSAAVTFYFRPDKGSGWALATVNDDTHELVIQSDWGNWTYRWSAAGMATGPDGRRCTLTEFIADRSEEYCDYLADKLTSHEERNQFDSYETVRRMRERLLKLRLEQGRRHISYYEDCEPDERVDVGTNDPKRWGPMDAFKVRCKYTHQDEDWYLTKRTARDIYRELGELEGKENQDHFLTAYFQIEGHTIIGDEPWHDDVLVFEPSSHYYQLLFGILPAVVRACEKLVRERESNAPCMAPEQRDVREVADL